MHSQQIPLLKKVFHPLHDNSFLFAGSLALKIRLSPLQVEQSRSIIFSAANRISWLQAGALIVLTDHLGARTL
jgi:hypothetical protein